MAGKGFPIGHIAFLLNLILHECGVINSDSDISKMGIMWSCADVYYGISVVTAVQVKIVFVLVDVARFVIFSVN